MSLYLFISAWVYLFYGVTSKSVYLDCTSIGVDEVFVMLFGNSKYTRWKKVFWCHFFFFFCVLTDPLQYAVKVELLAMLIEPMEI